VAVGALADACACDEAACVLNLKQQQQQQQPQQQRQHQWVTRRKRPSVQAPDTHDLGLGWATGRGGMKGAEFSASSWQQVNCKMFTWHPKDFI
jgi:hypothetical protein